jgi:FtsZ-interacting cell division protein ZipA
MANEAGGKDNITVQLVEFAVSIKQNKTQNKGLNKNLFFVTGLAVIVVLVVLIMAYSIFFRKDNAVEVDSNKTERTGSSVQNDTDRNEKDLSTDPEIAKDESPVQILEPPAQAPTPPAQTPEPPKQAPTPSVQTPESPTQAPTPPAQTPEPPTQAPTPPVPTPSAEAPMGNEPTVEPSQNSENQNEVNQTGSGSETAQ